MFEVIQINLSHSNRLQQTSSMPRINWLSNDHLKNIQKFLFYLTFMNIETSPIFVFNYYCPMDENYCMTISIWTMNQNYIIHFILLLMLCLFCSPLVAIQIFEVFLTCVECTMCPLYTNSMIQYEISLKFLFHAECENFHYFHCNLSFLATLCAIYHLFCLLCLLFCVVYTYFC